ncbi:MAG: class I SAM-dependent methyltransferase [Alcanivoracaceae bacterium]|nr:class I SAM-dependent methyltransferase [Alcanivoracaceae bacterium]
MGWYEDRVFPHLLDWATRPLNRQRRELLASAHGTVLELGVGTGANFPFYSEQAEAIHGIEPCGALLEHARESAYDSPNPARFDLRQAGAEALPYDDDTFDCVVACLVFCTIPEPDMAAREVRRVLKPGGELLVLEHVQHERPWPERLQRWLEPVWKPLACGCHLHRDTGALFRQAGFDTSGLETWQHPDLPAFAGFLLSGRALA